MSSWSTLEHGRDGPVHVFGTELGEPFRRVPRLSCFGYENRSGMAIIARVLVAVDAAIADTAGNLATNDAPVDLPGTPGATKRTSQCVCAPCGMPVHKRKREMEKPHD